MFHLQVVSFFGGNFGRILSLVKAACKPLLSVFDFQYHDTDTAIVLLVKAASAALLPI